MQPTGRSHESPAVIYSTFSGDWLRSNVLPDYGLDSGTDCALFHRGINDTYLITAGHGKFALRLYRSRWRTREAVLDEVSALLRLGTEAIPVAPPLLRLDGEPVTQLRAPEGDRSVVLFRWAEGIEPQYADPGHAKEYGRLAARLHNATDNFPPPAARQPLDMHYLLERPLANLRPALRNRPSITEYLEALAERIRSTIDSSADILRDWGFCHGDLHGGNARVDNGRFTLFDFDCCGTGWRVFDLATYRWAARLRELEVQAWEPFIAGYLELRPAAASTLNIVPLFVILRHLWLMGLHAWDAVEKGGSFQTDAFFDQLVKFCAQVEADYLTPI